MRRALLGIVVAALAARASPTKQPPPDPDVTASRTPSGLVATPGDSIVTLSCEANPEDDVAGYTVYVGGSEDDLEV